MTLTFEDDEELTYIDPTDKDDLDLSLQHVEETFEFTAENRMLGMITYHDDNDAYSGKIYKIDVIRSTCWDCEAWSFDCEEKDLLDEIAEMDTGVIALVVIVLLVIVCGIIICIIAKCRKSKKDNRLKHAGGNEVSKTMELKQHDSLKEDAL